MSLHPCPTPGCPELLPSKSRYCSKHLRQVEQSRNEKRALQPGRHLYYTKEWRSLRQAQLSAYPDCAVCGQPGTICDHVTPHRGDEESFWSGPFQTLCHHHHARKTAYETNERRRMTRMDRRKADDDR